MDIKEIAMMNYEKLLHKQEMETMQYTGQRDCGEPSCGQDTGDMIYCEIGELLEKIKDADLADQIDILILKMSDADKREYYIRGFEEGVNSANAIKI